MRQEYPCEVCKAPVLRYPYDLTARGRSGRVFCGRTCQSIWQRESGIQKGENSPNWKGNRIPVTCEICGTGFTIKPGQFKRFTHRFCSVTCRGKWTSQAHSGANSPSWKGGLITVNCNMCGKEIRKPPYALKDHPHKFCNAACRRLWMSQHMEWPTGAEHPSWKGGTIEYYGPNWYRQQRAARKRDNYKCRACGKPQKKHYRALDVHHIKPFRTFGYIPDVNDHYLQANELTNLITLCVRCHRFAEEGKIPLQPYLL